MPKFVPVVDNEKSQAEQRGDAEFEKHRRFDNPHKVDRGWQQGNVGWGVLGAFGSNSKDDAAQVIKRAEGSNKMIKNEKGLWVKSKELEEDTAPQSKPGRGRGGGVSVYDELAGRSMGSGVDSTSRNETHRSNQFDDAEERRKVPSKRRDSRDRYDDRRRDDRDDRRHDDKSRDNRGRDTYSRSKRSPSRSPDGRRDDRSRGDHYSRRDRSYSRSRSRSGDRHRRRDDRFGSGRDRDSRRSRSRSPNRSDRRDDSRDRKDTRRDGDRRRSPARGSGSSRDETVKATEPHKKKAINDTAELSPEEAALQAEMMRSITAVQVINRFHEVFSQDKLFASERLSSIGQVFAPGAVIASLKSGVVHITGKTGVEDSFAKTVASVPAISKRIYIERATEDVSNNIKNTTEEGEEPSATPAVPKVTFCLDFHRPGTAPGLGDRAKHTVLLYRCENAQISHIWGMVDHEQLSQPEELEQSAIMKSKVWALVKPIVVQDITAFDEAQDAHFHNYDRMEVWGMF